MSEINKNLTDSIISIASETFRFQRVFAKAISKLDIEEQNKYSSQFSWFSKKVISQVMILITPMIPNNQLLNKSVFFAEA